VESKIWEITFVVKEIENAIDDGRPFGLLGLLVLETVLDFDNRVRMGALIEAVLAHVIVVQHRAFVTNSHHWQNVTHVARHPNVHSLFFTFLVSLTHLLLRIDFSLLRNFLSLLFLLHYKAILLLNRILFLFFLVFFSFL